MAAIVKQRLRRLLGVISVLLVSFWAVGCTQAIAPTQSPSAQQTEAQTSLSVSTAAATEPELTNSGFSGSELATATFAGGCFWCMEQPFDQLPGVVSTLSGYTGGTTESPTYAQVSAGRTGHVEAMQTRYDPSQVSYEALLETFWHNIDPFDDQGQFCDKGSQYRSVIFYQTPEQQALAAASKQAVAERFDQAVATEILPADTFYPAEDYHQDYYITRPIRYKVYRFGCGRDQHLSDIWGADAPAHE
ncbi:MAG: peptide-methionine (S)-S-oxide reductase MsrA [Phormidesmis sp.]